MKKLYLFLPFAFMWLASSAIFAQTPDNTTGRMYLLGKVWGFIKYYHSEVSNCQVNWDSIALERIPEMLAASDNAAFNASVETLLAAAGPMAPGTGPSPVAEIPLNLDFGWLDEPLFNPGIRAQLHFIRDNFRRHPSCWLVENDYTDPNQFGYLLFPGENFSTPNPGFPEKSWRYLIMFRYWNIIRYFNPNNALMDQDWEDTLLELLPAADTASSELSWQLSLMRLIARIDDTHASLPGFSGNATLDHFFGDHVALIKLNTVEGQTVIAKKLGVPSAVSVGDIVLEIDGVPVETRKQQLAAFFAASNESVRNRDLNILLMRGNGLPEKMELKLQKADGSIVSTQVSRLGTISTFFNFFYQLPAGPSYQVTDCNYGYVNMGKLLSAEVPAMWDDLGETPAIIFDLRHYPNGTAWDLAPLLLPFPDSTLFQLPDLTFPEAYYYYSQSLNTNTQNGYTGKVILLINEETQSQGEYTAMVLRAHPHSFVIGSQTAGADGDVTITPFPGGLNPYLSSIGVFYNDTTPTQRIGIVPDAPVTPTLAGIRAGVDELLLAALDCLSSAEETTYEEASVSPSPAHDWISFVLPGATQGEVEVTLINLSGQEFLKETVPDGTLDISPFPAGIYFLKIISGGQSWGAKVIKQ